MSDAVPHADGLSLLADRLKQVLTDAPAPLPFADVKKKLVALYPKTTKKAPAPPKPTDDEIRHGLDAALARKEVYEHPAVKGKLRYGTTAPDPVPTAEEIVRGLVLAKLETGPGPFAAAELAKMPKGFAKPDFERVLGDALRELVAAGQLHEHPQVKGKKRYGLNPPVPVPTAEDIVRGLVNAKLESGPGPYTVAELAEQPTAIKGPEFKRVMAAVLGELLSAGQLHEHPTTGKTKRYGPKPPPPPEWYKTATFAKPFAAVLKAANTVLKLDGVTADQLLAALRGSLSINSPAAAPEPVRVAPPAHKPEPPPRTEDRPPDLRAALKDAYDYLCRFVEFRDKLVELPRLYHETAKRMPGLTPDAFRDELWQMSREHRVELHVLNEVALAKERDLAIYRDDRLYYYARWK